MVIYSTAPWEINYIPAPTLEGAGTSQLNHSLYSVCFMYFLWLRPGKYMCSPRAVATYPIHCTNYDTTITCTFSNAPQTLLYNPLYNPLCPCLLAIPVLSIMTVVACTAGRITVDVALHV